MTDYLDILKEWERTVANRVLYENIDTLFPSYGFVRLQGGTDKDRWVSPLKMNLSRPQSPTKEKTVVWAKDMMFREQGEWSSPVSVVDRLMEDCGMNSLFDAYKYIASRFGLEMPVSSGWSTKPQEATRKARLLKLLNDYFTWNLGNNPSADCRKVRAYLAKRGFSQEWIERFGFGFVPSWNKVVAYVTSPRNGYSEAELDSCCRVRSDEGYTSVGFRYLLSIPYCCAGELKGFLFRAVEEGVIPKYMACAGLDRKKVFFNMAPGRETRDLTVVEGEMDALSLTAAGIEGVVAIGGSDMSGERRSQIFDALGRNTRSITLCLDLDSGPDGKPNHIKRYNAVRKCLHSIFDVSPSFDNVKVAVFDGICDPDEFLRTRGVESMRAVLNRALPWWKYLYERRPSSN